MLDDGRAVAVPLKFYPTPAVAKPAQRLQLKADG